MDSILLKGISLTTRIGVPDEERATPQKITVDVELFHSTKDVATNDDITKGIDYKAVTETVQSLAIAERKTIERLAEDIGAVLLRKFTPESVKVTVWKNPDLPIASASVTILRP